ncbi:hypothetical protein AB0F81_04280 [Actinoplanes sp. NPDC024001]|uniref:hypothetical protein n=1 Tax=Actinoplanes sp. NPDC024001 TaxID=3154598 RepID=UPI0033E584F2
MDLSARHVRNVGTFASVAGFCWLVLLGDSSYDRWRMLAAVTLIGGLLLRIEAAVLDGRAANTEVSR